EAEAADEEGDRRVVVLDDQGEVLQVHAHSKASRHDMTLAFRRRSSIIWRDVMRRWTICGALATAVLVLIAASATAATLGPTTRVTVKPGSGTPRTRFAFSLRVPVATGRFGTL